MKTIWEVLVVVTLIALSVGGITVMGDKIFTTQTLDSESVNTLSGYSTLVLNYTQTYNKDLGNNSVDPYLETDLNEVEGFVQEYRDYKGKLDQLKDGLKLTYKFPDLFLYVVPFVEPEDLGDYIIAYRSLVIFLLMFIIIRGLKNGQVMPEF